MEEFEPQVPKTTASLQLTVGAIVTAAACFGLCMAASLSTALLIWAFAGSSDAAFVLLLIAPLAAVAFVSVAVATDAWADWNRRTLFTVAAGIVAAAIYAGSQIATQFNQMIADDTPGLGLGLLALPMVIVAVAGVSLAASLVATTVRTIRAIRSQG